MRRPPRACFICNSFTCSFSEMTLSVARMKEVDKNGFNSTKLSYNPNRSLGKWRDGFGLPSSAVTERVFDLQ